LSNQHAETTITSRRSARERRSFILRLPHRARSTFGGKIKSGGGLTGKQIIAGDPYTAYGEASIYGYKV